MPRSYMKKRERKKMDEKNGVCPLLALGVGKEGQVLGLDFPNSVKRRLLELGFSKGTRVCCIGKGPLGEPRAFFVRDRIVALRGRDASKIYITVKKEK